MPSELRVLGPLELLGDGGVVALTGQKHRRLLAALALADGQACPAESLVDAVWGESPPVSAPKLLQVYVSQLRKALPDGVAIVTRPAGYTLDVDGASLDAERFERLAAEAGAALEEGNAALAASLAEQALGLWRGPAYADVMYDEFARGEIERLEELRLIVTEGGSTRSFGWDATTRSSARSSRWPTSIRSANEGRSWRCWRSTGRADRWTRSSATRRFGAVSTRSSGWNPGRGCASFSGRSSSRILRSTHPAVRSTGRGRCPSRRTR